MNSPSSPPILCLDDDDDDYEQNHYFDRNASSMNTNNQRQKRKLTDTNVRINPTLVNWSKRQRNGHSQQQLTQNFIEPDSEPEPILLDPDEYIIEEPDPPSFRSFDWTIQPVPSPIISNKISSKPTTSRTSTISTSNVNNISKRPLENFSERFLQQQPPPQIKSTNIPAPRPSLALLSLPLPKPTSSLVRSNAQRGRPLKNSRVPHTQSTTPPALVRQQSESETSQRLPSTSTSEIRRQILNGTGIFSAFHDSKYYRCNICKFKSVTSSTLLQHLFTHMFFCDHCSYYTYSHYNLSQHIFEKHNINPFENISNSLNPKIFDLLYVTRCSDGTFALCMDSSTNKTVNTNDKLIISSAVLNDETENKSPKKKILKQKEFLNEEDNDIVLLTDKTKNKAKQNQTHILMKHRRCYTIKKSSRLHSLTSEYNICRENTIRQMCLTEHVSKRRKYLRTFPRTRLNDEIAYCLKTIVNQIVDNEEKYFSLICPLSDHILSSILPVNNLHLLKLKNKYDEYDEQMNLYKSEHSVRENRENVFILSSPTINHSDQLIISSLHSSMTNGDSIFTHTKIKKLPQPWDNTHRYLKGNLNTQTEVNKSNVKSNDIRPKPISQRPIVPKPKSSPPNVIILD